MQQKLTFLLSTSNQILKHPGNTSTVKYHYSFPRSARFPKQHAYTSTLIYESRDTKSKRFAGIGIGRRSSHFDGKNIGIPSPDSYNVSKTLRDNKTRGYSFGSPRQLVKFANYLSCSQVGNPAPGTYNLKSSRDSRAYSLRLKIPYPKDYFLPNNSEQSQSQTKPGPGQYESIDQIGSLKGNKASNHPNKGQKLLRNSPRFSKVSQTPGPGQYETEMILDDGSYKLSTMRSPGRRGMPNQKRRLKLNSQPADTPGPGQYEKPSDFGIYGGCTPRRPHTAKK